MPEYDFAVIGAGAAGLSVAGVAAQLGLRTALIERDRMGGDCLNAGCVPSKALLAAAHAAQAARAASRYGVVLPDPRVEWAAVQAHVRGVIDGIAPLDSEARYRSLGADVLRGEARFVAPDTLAVQLPGGERRITARRIVIAAGSRAAVPDLPGLDGVPILTNATLFDVPEQPAHLLILGGGSIGLEMAQAHAALGSRVTIVESQSLAGREDPELVDVLRQTLLRNGVDILEGTAVTAVAPGPTLALADGRRVAGSHLLVAVGRTPNLDGLAADAGNVAVTGRGVLVDAGLRSTSNKRVYAVGEMADPVGIGPRYLTHVGSYHAGLVVRRAMFRLPARVDYAALPRVTYTDPELAQVGVGDGGRGARGRPRRRHPALEPGRERPRPDGAADGGDGQVGGRQARPGAGRRHRRPARRRDDRRMDARDRPADSACGDGGHGRALSDPQRGRQARRRQPPAATPVRAAGEVGCAPGRSFCLKRDSVAGG